MSNSVLDAAHFHDEQAAYDYLELKNLAERPGLPALRRC